MRFDRIALNATGLAIAMLSAAAAHAGNSPFGVWIDHTGRGAVEISDCSGKLCGRVAWVKDTQNSSECGKQIIGDVESVGTNKWDNGWIYDPDRGKKFDVEVTALDGDKLRVKGYAGTKWLSETYTWKRAPADLQKCSTSAAAPAAPTETKSAAVDKTEGAPKPAVESRSGPVVLNAAKPDADADKAQGGKPAAPAPKADEKQDDTAKASPDDTAGDGEGRGNKGHKALARLMEELESGDGPVKIERTGKTCKVNVPYVDMVVAFRCDRDKDKD